MNDEFEADRSTQEWRSHGGTEPPPEPFTLTDLIDSLQRQSFFKRHGFVPLKHQGDRREAEPADSR